VRRARGGTLQPEIPITSLQYLYCDSCLIHSQKDQKYESTSFPWLVRSSPSEGAKRESRNFNDFSKPWLPAFAGMTSFCESIMYYFFMGN